VSDRRILDAVKAAKTALAEYRVICREANRLYHEAQCHPDMPERLGGAASPAEFKARERATRKIWHQTGYDVTADRRNEMRAKRLRPMFRRICRLRPRTVEGMSAKASALGMAFDVDYWDKDDFMEYALPVLLADLARLAGKAVT
jgi:hypothetical protein